MIFTTGYSGYFWSRNVNVGQSVYWSILVNDGPDYTYICRVYACLLVGLFSYMAVCVGLMQSLVLEHVITSEQLFQIAFKT